MRRARPNAPEKPQYWDWYISKPRIWFYGVDEYGNNYILIVLIIVAL